MTGGAGRGYGGVLRRPRALIKAMDHDYHKAMSVTISELKSRLSYYLGRVRKGETLIIRDRNTVIGRIEPAGGASTATNDDEERWLADLERRGIVRRASGTLGADWLARRPRASADVVDGLLRDRDEGR